MASKANSWARWIAPRFQNAHCLLRCLGFLGAATLSLAAPRPALSAPDGLPPVDVALFVAVDVSESVDEDRYKLQMEGIARALEDREVIQAITSGPRGGIGISLLAWSDKTEMALPWEIIRNAEEAKAVAAKVRNLPHHSGEYTCLGRMMTTITDSMLDVVPFDAASVVVDVSGDGIDNCMMPDETNAARDALVARRVTINGLPILVKGENDLVGQGAYRAPGFGLRPLPRGPAETPAMSLEQWFKLHVIGGQAAFLRAAHGYEDFGAAFRQKFLTEVSEFTRPRRAMFSDLTLAQ